MRAMVCERYGAAETALVLREVETPTPRRNQVRVRVRATSVTPSCVMLRSGRYPSWLMWLPARAMYGFTRPRRLIPGYELSGVVESVGADVTRFAPGDRVWGAAHWQMSCSADYVCLPETASLAPLPEGWSFAEAVALCDGPSTALSFLRKAGLRSGQHLLVHGASGSVGSAAVQIAKHLGADVTGVCSGANADLVKSLGADRVIDYTCEDFAERGELYDVIFDSVGKSDFGDCLRSLAPDGTYLTTLMRPSGWLRGLWVEWTSRKQVVGGITTTTTEKLAAIQELVEAGALRAVIDRCHALEELAQAHAYVELGHKRGNVVVLLDDDDGGTGSCSND